MKDIVDEAQKMEKNFLMDVMVKDHIRIINCLNDVKNNIKGKFEDLIESFDIFEWYVEKHFFVEERAIFSHFNPKKIDKSYEFFSKLSKQHTHILEKIESLRKRLRMSMDIDLSELETMIFKHQSYEEKNVYPVLDLEIDEGEKMFMIERIKDIKMD